MSFYEVVLIGWEFFSGNELFYSTIDDGFALITQMFQAQWSRRTDSQQYDILFCDLIGSVIKKTDGRDRQILLRRIYLESPMITEDAISLLKHLVMVSSTPIFFA